MNEESKLVPFEVSPLPAGPLARLEIHPDHRATGFLVWSALQAARASNVIPVPTAYEISVQKPVNLFIDITEQRPAKEAVMAIYASQNSQN